VTFGRDIYSHSTRIRGVAAVPLRPLLTTTMTIQLGVGRLVVSVVGVVLRGRSTHSGHRLRARAAADAAGRYRQSLQSAARSGPWRE